MPTQEIRALLGWLDQGEAVAIQLGGVLPAQGQDITPQLERFNAARGRVAAREEYALPTPDLEPLPAELRARGQAVLQRPDIAAGFRGFDISVGVVDLRRVLSFQKIVSSEGQQRVAAINTADPQALFSFCLPDPGAAVQLPVAIDLDGKGFSLSSTNPNLRVLGGQNAMINGQPFLGFAVGFGLTVIQVVEYQGRWFTGALLIARTTA